MNITELAKSITQEDRERILNNRKGVRRSRIEVIDDTKKNPAKPQPKAVVPGKRQSVSRQWPQVGTLVTATNPWTGEIHEVQVVENKKRKHGVEFEIASGDRFHSPSPLCQYLFGKRVSNGWNCISWEGQ